MGTGGGTGRAARRVAPTVAAVAGATAIAALAGRRWRHRDVDRVRDAPLPPRDDLGGAHPPIAPSPAAAVGAADAESGVPEAAGPVAAQAPPDAPATPATAPAVAKVLVDVPPPAVTTAAGGSAPSLVAPLGGRHMATPRRPRRGVGAIIGVVLVVVLGAGAMVAAGIGGGGSSRSDDAATAGGTGTTGSTTTTITAPPPASEAFGQAAERLRDAGSFGYTGAARASDVSQARPMLWLAVESTIEGQVDTSTGRVHEVAVATDGTTSETVTDGPLVWGRKAPAVESLPDEAYQSVPGLSGDELPVKGMARLPQWLAAAVDPLDAGADGQGRRLYQATIPPEVLGVIERERAPVGATALLTLDDAGDPVRVELTSAPGGPTFHLVFEVTRLGEAVAITPPGHDTSA